MKCFEIFFELKKYSALQIWTLNMKCFEIKEIINKAKFEDPMNLKHEMFWNVSGKTMYNTRNLNEP